MAKDRPDLKQLRRKEADSHRLAMGADSEGPEPGFRTGGRPARLHVHALDKGGKEAYVEPVIEAAGYRFAVKSRQTQGRSKRQERHQASRGTNLSA